MASVVQATCPGCKRTLRIPADWSSKSIRCKHCGAVLQAKTSAKPAGVRSAPPARTPPPAPKAEVAVPVAATAAPGAARYRRSRRGGAWWLGPAVALTILVVAGVAGLIAWPYLSAALYPKTTTTDSGADPNNGGLTTTPTNKPNPKEPIRPSDAKGQVFPRRALVISVHNYLYANPIHAGMPLANARNIPNFLDALNRGLHIPTYQMAQLSDGAAKGQARSPMKPVIEKSLTKFLEESRPQDRILVFFIGHGVAIDGEMYLAPIEGELSNAASLIPLKWVYEQMAKCPARQKVLVMDVNRLNPGHGLERPNGGPMDPKEDAALNAPPAGVQVLTACVAGQQSYELDDAPMGLFLDEMDTALVTDEKSKGLKDKIQHPDDPVPMERLRDLVNTGMKRELSEFKLEQTARLAGEEATDGAPYDKSAPPAPAIVLAAAEKGGSPKAIQSVLNEIGVPPVKPSRDETGVRFEVLPPFPVEKMKDYPEGGDDTPLRKAILKAREVIYAVSTANPPPAMANEVGKIRQDLKVNLSVLKDGYRKPSDDARFKKQIEADERKIADLLASLQEALDELKTAGDNAETGRAKETKRWQANYDFTLARLEAQMAYLFEYQSMLGQMRKQLPDLAPGQTGWRLASQVSLKGDTQGKKLAKDSSKHLDAIIKDNPGTPWEVLAKREKLTALGLEWQGVKSE
jgi:Caspase domain